MRELSGRDINEERKRLEREAATTLGFIILGFARLEVEVGLQLCEPGDAPTKKIKDAGLKEKLDCFLEMAIKKYGAGIPETIDAFEKWSADAQRLRRLRNQFIHGRWGVEVREERVVNVVGLPTDPEQTATSYTLSDLEKALSSVEALRARFGKLIERFPLHF